MQNVKDFQSSMAEEYFHKRIPLDEHSFFRMEATQEKAYLRFNSMGKDYIRTADIKFTVFLDSSIDIQRLSTALKDTVKAHATFSSGIVERNGIPMLTREEFPFPLDVKEIKDEDYDDCFNAFANTPREEGSALYRFQILKTPTKVYLLVRICHGLIDGQNTVAFMTEVCSRYNGYKVQAEQYSIFDYSDFKETFTASKEGHKLLAEFGNLLADFPKVNPTIPSANVSVYDGMLFDKNELHSLRSFTNKLKINAATMLLAAYSLALMRLEDTNRIAYCMDFHGRSIPLFARTFGSIAHKIPVLAKIPESGSVEEYLRTFDQMQHLMQDKYSIIDRGIMREYSHYINYQMSLNIILSAHRPFYFDGKEAPVAMTPFRNFQLPLVAVVNVKPAGWAIHTTSCRWNADELQALHKSVRDVMFGMAQKEYLGDI